MRKLNKPLLRRLARKLRRLRHEEHYDQRHLGTQTACGTAACIAGHAVIEAGFRLRMDVDGDGFWEYDSFPARAEKCSKPGERPRSIWNVAEQLLGLTPSQSDRLFDADPTCVHDYGPGWVPTRRSWPDKFADRWDKADPKGKPTQRRSRIAADLLDAIADTNGKILA